MLRELSSNILEERSRMMLTDIRNDISSLLWTCHDRAIRHWYLVLNKVSGRSGSAEEPRLHLSEACATDTPRDLGV